MVGRPASELAPPDSLFARLRAAAGVDWTGYTRHNFVLRLAEGSLPEASFRHYLVQDYLFLIQFARAYALAVYKSDSLADMRQAGAAMSAILDLEMGLHVEFCAGWGLDEVAMAAICSICMWRWRPALSAMRKSPPNAWPIRRPA
jgi:thiaminase/transcriptional activator TenA